MLAKDTKFAIIGAGPAGISTALALREQGYTNIILFEKEAEVGGKCRSFHYQGRVYDLGANLTTPRYDGIRALGNKLGMNMRLLPERRIVNVGKASEEDALKISYLKKIAIRIGSLVYLFFRDLTQINQNGYQSLKSGVEKPFRLWLAHHGLSMFEEMFEVLFVAYGYGHVMDLPAAYALKFFDRNHFNASVNVILGKEVATTLDFQEGFQELWKRIVSAYGLFVINNSVIEQVERNPGGVKISYRFKEGSVLYSDHFDKVVFACPLQEINFLDSLGISEEEKELFSQIKTYEYYTLVSRISGLPPVSTYVYPYAKRLIPGYPTVFYPPYQDDIFVSYAYGGPGVSEETVLANLKKTVENPLLGGKLEEVLYIQKWDYFPHIDSEAMLNGFYDRLEKLQGQYSTYYVGEILSFTLTELILDYARKLVKDKIACTD